MERLRIEYETAGYLELNVEAFFPCKMPIASKVAPLIRRYCTDCNKAGLLAALTELADGYTALCDMYKGKMEECPADSGQHRHWRAQFNKTEVLRRRAESNIKIIFGGKGNGHL